MDTQQILLTIAGVLVLAATPFAVLWKLIKAEHIEYLKRERDRAELYLFQCIEAHERHGIYADLVERARVNLGKLDVEIDKATRIKVKDRKPVVIAKAVTE